MSLPRVNPPQMTEHRITLMSHTLGCRTVRHSFLRFVSEPGYSVMDGLCVFLIHVLGQSPFVTTPGIPSHPGLPSNHGRSENHQSLPRTLSHTDIVILEPGVQSEYFWFVIRAT